MATITASELRERLKDGTAPQYIKRLGKRLVLYKCTDTLWGYQSEGKPQGDEVAVLFDQAVQQGKRGRAKHKDFVQGKR